MSESTDRDAGTPTAADDTIGRLAARGEQTLHRLAELPGGHRLLQGVNDLRSAVDDLGRRVRGTEALERRVAELEAELAALKASQAPPGPPAA